MEVMGLMLGEYVDEYTVQVIDVFAMPQSGTSVSVESVDHIFQKNMVDMLKQTGRSVLIVYVPMKNNPQIMFVPASPIKIRDSSGVVPLTSRVWLLAVKCRY